MSQINVKKTDTPQTPDTDRVGIFINTSGQAKTINDAGTESLLAGISDAPSDGTDYVRKDAAWVTLSATYPEATIRENNTVLFDKDYIIGNAAARSGNILFDFTGAKLGAETEMRHADVAAFTFPATAKFMFDITDVSTTVDNFFLCKLTDKTVGAEVVKVFHALEGGVL